MGLFDILKGKLEEVQKRNRDAHNEKTAPSEVFDRMKKKLEDLESNPSSQASTSGGSGGLFGALKDKLEEVRQENREAHTEETAEPSIFDKMKQELEALESKKDSYEGAAGSEDVWSRTPDVLGTNTPKVESNDEMGSIFDKLESNVGTGNVGNKERGDYSENFDETDAGTNIESGNVGRGGNNQIFQIGSMVNTNSNGGSLQMRVDPHMGAGTLTTRVPSNASIRVLEYSDQNKINLDGQVSGWYKVDYQGQQGWLLAAYLF